MQKRYKISLVILMAITICGIALYSDIPNVKLSANQREDESQLISPPQPLQKAAELPEELMPIALEIAEKNNINLFSLQSTGTKISEPIQIVNPVVFIELKNADGSYDSEWITPENLAKADTMYNTGTNSLRNYFKKISYGNIDIITEFYPRDIEGNITSIKSPFYKSFVMPQAGAPDFIVGDETDPRVGYNPAVGEYLGNLQSSRTHEQYVYRYALEDTVSTGDENLSVAAQIGGAYKDKYDLLNSRYSTVNDFWEWEDEFAWEGTAPGTEGTSWADYFKTWELLSADNFTFVLRASDAEAQNSITGATNDILWPHNFSWSSNLPPLMGEHIVDPVGAQLPLPGLYVDGATTVYADNGQGIFADNPDIGVITHETIHQFGAPDLYRRSYKGQAVGVWDIMGAQQEMPQTMLYYTNNKYGIWETPEPNMIGSGGSLDDRKDLVINAANYTDTDQDIVYQIYPNDYDTRREYFVVEYKKKTESSFDSQLPSSGLLVYRVKDDISQLVPGETDVICGLACGNGFGPPDEIFVFRPNAANADLLNQPSIDQNLNAATLPRTVNGNKVNKIGKSLEDAPITTFDKDTLYFSDGTNSAIQIVNISDPGETSMKFTVLFDGESLSTGNEITDLTATSSKFTLRSGDTVEDNTLSVHGGIAPYIFQIEETTKDGVTYPIKHSGFFIKDEDESDTTALLSFGTMLRPNIESGVWNVTIKVSDDKGASKSLIINYKVYPDFPKSNDNYLIKYNQKQAYKESEIADKTVLGNMKFTVCDDDTWSACATKYAVNKVSLDIKYLVGSDYSEYFEYDSENKQIIAKKKIPAGTYNFIGILTFELAGESDKVLRNNNLKVVINPDEGDIIPTSKPTITTPTGAALTTTWVKGDQNISFDIADTNKGLKSVSVTTTDGNMVVDAVESKTYTKNYEESTVIKNDTISLDIRKNGIYTVSASNWDNEGNEIPVIFEVTHLDNEKPIIDSLELSAVRKFLLFPTGEQNVSVVAHDLPETSHSGFEKYRYKLALSDETIDKEDDSSWQEKVADDTIVVDKDFQGKLYIYAYDKVGNKSNIYEEIITRDTPSPTHDVSLSSLQVAGVTLSPSFQASVDTYQATVENSVNCITIAAVASDPSAVLSGDANKVLALVDGENKFSIIVTNNGESKTYKVNITRKSASIDEEIDTTLSSLQITGATLSPSFQASVDTYQATVENSVKNITIAAVASDPSAVLTGDANKALALVDGENKYSIIVTNAEESKTYKVNITRKSASIDEEIDTTLSSLKITGVTLSPSFQASIDTYQATVENSVKVLSIVAVASDPSAVITGDANKVLSLVDGENKFSIIVTNNGESKTYKVNITRKAEDSKKSSDASLKSLTSDVGKLSPLFNVGATLYAIEVENTVTAIKLAASTTSAKATLSGDVNKAVDLKVGVNTLSIEVKAEDGTSKTYKIIVTRKDVDAPSEEDTPKPTIKALMNSDKTITVTGEFTNDIKLISKVLEASSVLLSDEEKATYSLKMIYDIYLEDQNGKRFEPTKTVTVRLNLTDELKGKQNLVAIYVKDDGTIEKMPTTVYSDYIEFTTTHFSKYGVAEIKENDTITDVNTGDTTNLLLLGIVILGSSYMCILMRRRKQYN